MKNVFMTAVYPSVEPYLDEFISSLSKQTEKGFTLCVLNDGLVDVERLFHAYTDTKIFLNVSGTPAEVRLQGIKYLSENGCENLIFGDSDDTFSNNRVEHSLNLLECHDIVVNDLDLFGGQNKERYLSSRMEDMEVISISSLLDKNFMGMSNTSINLKNLPQLDIQKCSLPAFDWFYYSYLMSKGNNALFTSRTSTNYRQYGNNIAKLSDFSEEDILKGVDIKLAHYSALVNEIPEFSRYNAKFISIRDALGVPELLQGYCQVVNQSLRPFTLWWEHIIMAKLDGDRWLI